MTTKKILLISTGGTIAGQVASEEDDSKKKKVADDFKNTIKPATETIQSKWSINLEITPHGLCNVDSSDIMPHHWTELSEKIFDEYENYDSFIITHGTNTLGYTCAALSFAFENINKPIILTGSQVPFGEPGSDALMNLDNALRIAVWPYDDIKGVVAVFGSHIITGTRVKKGTEFDYDAFRSFSTSGLGQIGRVIQIHRENLLTHCSYLSKHSNIALGKKNLIVKNAFNMRIASLTEFPGMSKDLFKTLVEKNGVKGFILRSFGAGDASGELRGAFEYLKSKRIPIVVTTQAPNGNSNFQVNTPGQNLAANDLAIPAYDMSIESQTIKLSWLLGQEYNYEEIKQLMVKDLRGEIHVTRDVK